MLEIWNYINAIGIGLQIVGFILLLIEFREKIRKQVWSKAESALQKHIENVNKDKDNPPPMPKEILNFKNNTYEKRLVRIGIIFVISGLAFQLASIFVENLLK